MTEHKMGKPSQKEIAFIRKQSGQMSDEDIAATLNRPVSTVLKIKSTHGIDCVQEEFDDKEKIKDLRGKPFYKRLKRQLTPEEVLVFHDKYIRYSGQFNNEIPPTEESIIVDLIRNEIMVDRLLEESAKSRIIRESLDKIMEEAEEELLTNTAKDRDKVKDLVKDIANQISIYESSGLSRSREIDTLGKSISELRKQLKATREQRVKRLEESKTNFISLLKEAMTSEWQAAEGDYLGLFNLSAKKLAKKLSEPHVYSDGIADVPVLNADTVDNLLEWENDDKTISVDDVEDNSEGSGDGN